jgi:thiazole synthase
MMLAQKKVNKLNKIFFQCLIYFSFSHSTLKIQHYMLKIADKTFSSRLLLGTGKFASPELMQQAVAESGTQLVTVALKRVDIKTQKDAILPYLKELNIHLLPNTSGVRTAKEAVFAAQAAREALETNWLKLEIHPDPKYLMPDAVETLKAAEELVKAGFVVLPYIHADPVLCKRLEDIGIQAVMPLGAPIGSNKGLATQTFLEIIIEQSNVPVIVDAGIGAPSHAARAMELGADAVLVNTAIAVAGNPVAMANAFRQAVEAGRTGFEATLARQSTHARHTSPLEGLIR